MTKQKFKLYRVDWIDASSESGWKKLDNIDTSHIYIHTVGWLIKETKDYLFLAQNLSSSYSYNDIMMIPKGWKVRKRIIPNNIIEYNRG